MKNEICTICGCQGHTASYCGWNRIAKFLLTAVLIFGFQIALHAQTTTTNQSGGTTTVTGAPSENLLSGDLGNVLGDLGLSSNPTNYAAAAFFGKKTSGKKISAGLVVIENVNNYIGVAAGIDHLWFGGKAGSANIVNGGISMRLPLHPLSFLSSNTNSWFSTFIATPFDIAMVGTPINGTGNSDGGLAAINRAGVNLDIYNLKGFKLAGSVDYGSRTGSGGYDGNWLDFSINLRKGF
jgi:hypothetical protein